MSTITSEKLFYIMDFNSNYYRVDSKDQLVVAGSENDATIFSFANANRRIGAGPKSKFYFMTPVEENNKEIEEIHVDKAGQKNETEESDSLFSVVKGLKEAEISKAAEVPTDAYDLASIDWEEYLTNFAYIASNINCYKDELNQRLAEVDKKICDVLHYIELCDTDKADAQDLVELLRVCRENRREYKDEMYRAEMFQKNVGTNANIAKAKEAIKSIKGLENRKYKAREFSELFDGGVYTGKTHREKRCIENSMSGESSEEFVSDEKEESKMECTKKATPFDGRENDWLAFARGQAEFYENADQYIINLELELDEIDNDIALLMDEIEHATCNVSQGYKFFKRMKDLRQTRTMKETELKILYNLTGNFDMKAMAEESRRSLKDIGEILNGPTTDIDEGEDENQVMESEIIIAS